MPHSHKKIAFYIHSFVPQGLKKQNCINLKGREPFEVKIVLLRSLRYNPTPNLLPYLTRGIFICHWVGQISHPWKYSLCSHPLQWLHFFIVALKKRAKLTMLTSSFKMKAKGFRRNINKDVKKAFYFYFWQLTSLQLVCLTYRQQLLFKCKFPQVRLQVWTSDCLTWWSDMLNVSMGKKE